jgi:hypothetical protein
MKLYEKKEPTFSLKQYESMVDRYELIVKDLEEQNRNLKFTINVLMAFMFLVACMNLYYIFFYNFIF